MTERSAPPVPGSLVQESLPERRDFARSFDSLEKIFAFVRGILGPHGVDEADAYAIVMAIEELFTNMVKYNASGRGQIALEIRCGAREVTCSLTDPDSDRFDVNAVPDANIHLPVEQRRPGGLGIYLIRRMVDSIDYDYADRRSRITFRKTLARELFRLVDPTNSK
jgi:anti-sigma regulatory factor (Ser/Thr protein kinase)